MQKIIFYGNSAKKIVDFLCQSDRNEKLVLWTKSNLSKFDEGHIDNLFCDIYSQSTGWRTRLSDKEVEIIFFLRDNEVENSYISQALFRTSKM